jgi:hypothetical protein
MDVNPVNTSVWSAVDSNRRCSGDFCLYLRLPLILMMHYLNVTVCSSVGGGGSLRRG